MRRSMKPAPESVEPEISIVNQPAAVEGMLERSLVPVEALLGSAVAAGAGVWSAIARLAEVSVAAEVTGGALCGLSLDAKVVPVLGVLAAVEGSVEAAGGIGVVLFARLLDDEDEAVVVVAEVFISVLLDDW